MDAWMEVQVVRISVWMDGASMLLLILLSSSSSLSFRVVEVDSVPEEEDGDLFVLFQFQPPPLLLLEEKEQSRTFVILLEWLGIQLLDMVGVVMARTCLLVDADIASRSILYITLFASCSLLPL